MDTPQVYKAISEISGALAKEGISKAQTNKQQGYQFRGIDDVYYALAPLLVKHNLVIIPRYTSHSSSEQITRDGKGKLFYTVVEAEYDLVSVTDGSKHTGKGYGEAMDSADKGTGKAESSCYKSFCFQLFCIPTEGDNDIENNSHEVAAHGPKPSGKLSTEQAEIAMGMIQDAFTARQFEKALSESILGKALKQNKFPNLVGATPEFVNRLIDNINNGKYDGLKSKGITQ